MLTTPGPGRGSAVSPGAVPFRLASELTKSCAACGLWHPKHALKFALSLTFLSAVNDWYSHSPLRMFSGYSAPQPVRFSITAYARGPGEVSHPIRAREGAACRLLSGNNGAIGH